MPENNEKQKKQEKESQDTPARGGVATAEKPTKEKHPPKPSPKEVSLKPPPLPEGTHYIWGVGRRKSSVARVRIRPGGGNLKVNNHSLEDYFTEEKDRQAVLLPLKIANMLKSWNIWVNVKGGGHTGQAGAILLGLARALCGAVPEVESKLRHAGLLTRDSRMKERKKYGQPGARKRFQYSKR